MSAIWTTRPLEQQSAQRMVPRPGRNELLSHERVELGREAKRRRQPIGSPSRLADQVAEIGVAQPRGGLDSVSSTGCRSKVERLMTLSTSLVAVWYSSDSCKIAGALAQFAEQPRVLHRDDRLGGEVLQQRDLLVGKWPHFSGRQI